MKNTFTTLFLFISYFCFTQDQIAVNYELTYDIDASRETRPQWIKILKDSSERKYYYKLITNNKESIYLKDEGVDNKQESESGDKIYISFANFNEFYKDLTDNKYYRFHDYNGKKFLVSDSISKQPWILVKEQDEYIGYKVKKAYYKTNDILYEAWYTDELKYKNGPADNGGLPGLILKLFITYETQQFKRIENYLVTNIKIDNKYKIKKPKQGELVTLAEYKEKTKLIDKKNSEFRNVGVETD